MHNYLAKSYDDLDRQRRLVTRRRRVLTRPDGQCRWLFVRDSGSTRVCCTVQRVLATAPVGPGFLGRLRPFGRWSRCAPPLLAAEWRRRTGPGSPACLRHRRLLHSVGWQSQTATSHTATASSLSQVQ